MSDSPTQRERSRTLCVAGASCVEAMWRAYGGFSEACGMKHGEWVALVVCRGGARDVLSRNRRLEILLRSSHTGRDEPCFLDITAYLCARWFPLLPVATARVVRPCLDSDAVHSAVISHAWMRAQQPIACALTVP